MEKTNEIIVAPRPKPPVCVDLLTKIPVADVIDVPCVPPTTALAAAPPVALPALPLEPLRQFIDNRMVAIGMLLFIGPVGLLAVWLNRRFHRITKIAWTIFFLLVTVVLPISLTWYWCNTALRPLVDVFPH